MPTIDISQETYELIRDQLSESERVDLSAMEDMIGKTFFFRTVTYHFVGKVVKTFGSYVQLERASWVADSGRFMQAVKEGSLSEVEPLGEWYVNMDTVTDFGPWNHALPTKQK